MGKMVVGAALSLILATGVAAQDAIGTPAVGEQNLTASATLMNANGDRVGTAELVQTPNDAVLIQLDVQGLEPGTHAFHIHQTGRCSAPDFRSAGGHFAPRGRSHGILHPHGEHAGDMMNLRVPAGGSAQTERLARHVTLVPGAAGFLFDEDGSALVIHAGADDYQSQPSGDAGSRVACGVIR